MEKFSFLAPVLFTCFAGPALSQSLPRYNVESYCKEVADVSGGSAMIFNGCIDMEQQAYDALKQYWATLPARPRNYCNEVAKVTGGSYSILEGCIEMETEAAGAQKSFEY